MLRARGTRAEAVREAGADRVRRVDDDGADEGVAQRGEAMNPRETRSSAEYPDASFGSENVSACSAPPSGLAMVTS